MLLLGKPVCSVYIRGGYLVSVREAQGWQFSVCVCSHLPPLPQDSASSGFNSMYEYYSYMPSVYEYAYVGVLLILLLWMRHRSTRWYRYTCAWWSGWSAKGYVLVSRGSTVTISQQHSARAYLIARHICQKPSATFRIPSQKCDQNHSAFPTVANPTFLNQNKIQT